MAVNEIDIYNEAVEQLKKTPNSLAHQHQAVLALARVGSLDFALTEYTRYGLDKQVNHSDKRLLEDIISLNGRLLKDLYLTSSGKVSKDYARQSSEKYEQAFKLTGGYYSAINAASMALMADVPLSMISHRAQDILRLLPPFEDVDSETRYFIEATRAEAALLLGHQFQAQRSLKIAIQHDPLNYAAHVTTLKQLDMILEKRGESRDWLTAFRPPKPIHFTGHLFKIGNKANNGEFENLDYTQLRIDISDALQQQNIGFGYGALAAGADIVFAETLLEEGGAFHAVLPVEPELFIKHSVAPFGQDWTKRFKYCWEAASSRHVISTKAVWPNSHIDDFSSRIAMGKAVQMAQRFSIDPQQFALWDKQIQNHGTARNVVDWKATGRHQIIFPYTARRRTVNPNDEANVEISINATLHQKNTGDVSSFRTIIEAINHASILQNQHGHSLKFGLHADISMNKDMDLSIVKRLSRKALPGSVLVSEVAASLLLFEHENKYAVDFIGQCEDCEKPIRIFSVKPRS